jgi:hypothetical protein
MENEVKNLVINQLTIKELKQYCKSSLIAMLYQQQDWACNIDYVIHPIQSDIIHKNISLIESILIYKEY